MLHTLVGRLLVVFSLEEHLSLVVFRLQQGGLLVSLGLIDSLAECVELSPGLLEP